MAPVAFDEKTPLLRSKTPRFLSPRQDLRDKGLQKTPQYQVDILTIEKEAVISSSKPKLTNHLALLLGEMGEDADAFLLFSARVNSMVRAWFRLLFDELLSLHRYFDTTSGNERIEKENMTAEEVREKEHIFLHLLFHMMNKSNYKMVSDAEEEVALSGQYLLSVPINLDKTKIDVNLLQGFFEKYPLENKPSFATEYLLFRRGVGVDQTTGWFINEKLDLVLRSIWDTLCGLFRGKAPRRTCHYFDTRTVPVSDCVNQEQNLLSIERIRIENMQLSLRSLFSRNTIQEPAFQRIILVYRRATPPDYEHPLGDRGIYIKQFLHIPIADMEIVLPEKMTPSMTPQDWAKFATTVVTGLVAVVSAASLRMSFKVIATIAIAFGSYVFKIYFAWTSAFSTYQALIGNAMYDKQLDSGRGTLLHLCDDVWQQEFKETVVSYFVLLTQGQATKQELDKRCAELLATEFDEVVKFDGQDALDKLNRLGLLIADDNGRHYVQPLENANRIVGETTDELYGHAEYNLLQNLPGGLTPAEGSDISQVTVDAEDLARVLFSEITTGKAKHIKRSDTV